MSAVTQNVTRFACYQLHYFDLLWICCRLVVQLVVQKKIHNKLHSTCIEATEFGFRLVVDWSWRCRQSVILLTRWTTQQCTTNSQYYDKSTTSCKTIRQWWLTSIHTCRRRCCTNRPACWPAGPSGPRAGWFVRFWASASGGAMFLKNVWFPALDADVPACKICHC